MSAATVVESARRFVETHLSACAADVLLWRRTGLLPEGAKLRVVADMYTREILSDGLQSAEDLVVRVTLERAAASPTPALSPSP